SHNIQCRVQSPHDPYHIYYQPGDVIVGGIVTLAAFLHATPEFSKVPPPPLPEELLRLKQAAHLYLKLYNPDEIRSQQNMVQHDLIPKKTLDVGYDHSQPVSICTGSCHPGSSKKMKEEQPFCCYDCISCPHGKISEKE
ncbi:hypothetical protein E2320_003055, partial [Naja naja]